MSSSHLQPHPHCKNAGTPCSYNSPIVRTRHAARINAVIDSDRLIPARWDLLPFAPMIDHFLYLFAKNAEAVRIGFRHAAADYNREML